MTRRRLAIGLALLLVALPLAALLGAAVGLRLLNPVLLGGPSVPLRVLVSAGERREYLVHVPRDGARAKPWPLVLCLPGAMLLPSTQARISRWDELADREGILVVYPAGRRLRALPLLPALPVWMAGSAAGVRRDARFLGDLIAEMERQYPVDRSRIYLSGFSNGGAMALEAACPLADRVAAVGVVAPALARLPGGCAGARPMPTLVFHGTADPLVPYGGPTSPAAVSPTWGVPRLVAEVARRNGCRTVTDAPAAADVSRRDYSGCEQGASVTLFTVHGGGHTWPGGGTMPRWLAGRRSVSVDATARMWAFFRQHPLPAGPQNGMSSSSPPPPAAGP